MKIKALLAQQGVHDPALESALIEAINTGGLEVPPHSIPMNPIETDDQQLLEPVN